MKLVYIESGKEVAIGDLVHLEQDCVDVEAEVVSFEKPYKSEPTSLIYIEYKGTLKTDLVAIGLIGAEWIEREDREEPIVLPEDEANPGDGLGVTFVKPEPEKIKPPTVEQQMQLQRALEQKTINEFHVLVETYTKAHPEVNVGIVLTTPNLQAFYLNQYRTRKDAFHIIGCLFDLQAKIREMVREQEQAVMQQKTDLNNATPEGGKQ